MVDHFNYESRVFKNLELEEINNNLPQKLSIKTFDQIRKLNPDIDYIKGVKSKEKNIEIGVNKENSNYTRCKSANIINTKSQENANKNKTFNNIKSKITSKGAYSPSKESIKTTRELSHHSPIKNYINKKFIGNYKTSDKSNQINNLANFSKNKFYSDVLSSNNPITNHHTNKYSGNLKFVKKENNTFYYEEKNEDEKYSSKNLNESKSQNSYSSKTYDSNLFKESLLRDKSGENFSLKNSLKPNNKLIDDNNYQSYNHKQFNKMKFQHFNYEPNRAYYV